MFFLLNLCFAQIKFETDLKYKISWENKSQFEYYTEIEEGKSAINTAGIIKFDNRFIVQNENVILNYIIDNLNEGSFCGLTKLNGDTLTKKQLFKSIYWKWDIDNHSGDTIIWNDIEEIEFLRIHQEWNIDTSRNTISNKVLGISILRQEEKKEVLMLYIPFNNEYASSLINVSSVVYIRQMNNKYHWKSFPKEIISKLLTKTNEAFVLLGNSNNPQNLHNKKTNKLDSLFREIDLPDKHFAENIIKYSEGIQLSQLLYIDYEKRTINTKLNALAPLFPINDDNDNFKYYKPLYWVNIKESD